MDNIEKNRGPGAPMGRRPVVWICSAIVGSNLVTEKCVVQDQSPGANSPGSFPKEVAEQNFVNKHGQKPEIILGPFFEKRGGIQSDKPKRKRLSVDRSELDKYKIELKGRNAIFGDWKGFSNAIEGNPDLAFFLFISENTPSGKQRSLPAPGIVNISDLQFIND